jgi:hypothetical protein
MEQLTDLQLEEFCFLHLALNDFDEAESAFAFAIQYPQLAQRLVPAGIVAYARPFQKCRGEHRTWNLSTKMVPKERRTLHQAMLDFRNQFFAHTDLKEVKPQLPRILVDEGGILPAVGYRKVNCQALLGDGIEISTLIKEVRCRVSTRKNELASHPPFRQGPLIVGR